MKASSLYALTLTINEFSDKKPSNKEIADMLFISERTVVGHKTNMLSKTGCKSTLGLLTYAIKHKAVII